MQKSGLAFRAGMLAASLSNGAVPEPAIWAMMLGGFGLIGGVLRSSCRTMLSFA